MSATVTASSLLSTNVRIWLFVGAVAVFVLCVFAERDAAHYYGRSIDGAKLIRLVCGLVAVAGVLLLDLVALFSRAVS